MKLYKDASDKEEVLIQLFMRLFAEWDSSEVKMEPYIQTIGEEYVHLFYKYLWVKFDSPLIDNFGLRFFKEIAHDTNYQIFLLRSFMKALC